MLKAKKIAKQVFLIGFLLLELIYSGNTIAQDEKLNAVEKKYNSGLSVNISASKVNISTLLSIDKVQPGSQFQVAVILDIQNNWHINANIPSLDFLIGTELNLSLPQGIRVVDIHYPKSHKMNFAFTNESLDVYQDSVVVFVVLKTSPKISEGDYNIQGSLQVQACNDQVCLAPSKIDIMIPIEIVGLSESVRPINSELFSSVSGPSSTISSDINPSNIISNMFSEEGVLLAFLGVFVIGLALNLTPCVYPMLSVTVSIFSAQKDDKIWRTFLKALVYVLGIATMYSILGVSAAFSGSLFGGIIQSPWVLLTIGFLLFGLALSMFGLYELQLPYWLRKKLGETNTTGLAGIYLSGLIVGIFAAPCIGPPIIALLAFVGTKGDPIFGFWIFFILALGLGSPYLILGTFSNLLLKIPKSGVWMIWVKKIFGVVMTGAALFYIGLALYPNYIVYLLPLIIFIGGIYLGFLESSGRVNRKLRKIQWVFGIICIIISIVFLQQLQKPTIEWQPYSSEMLKEAKVQQNPVILDFYADWCIPCLELDRITFTDDKVIKATEDFVKLKVDLTQFTSEESELLRKRFNVSGVPTIIFLNSDGNEIKNSRMVGYINPDEFIKQLQNFNSIAWNINNLKG